MAEPTYNQSTINDTLAKIEQQFGALQAEREANTVKSRTAGLDAATEEAYRQRQLQGQQAQNQFAQNTMGNQLSALDAIRTSNASQIASGANAGLAAANQLSAILGLQESNNEAATNIANDAITAASERNTAMAQNAVTAQSQVDQQNQSIREVEAQLQAVQAELAKASSQEEAARESASAEKYKADKQTATETESNLLKQKDQARQDKALQADKDFTYMTETTAMLRKVTEGWNDGGDKATRASWTDPWTGKKVEDGDRKNDKKTVDQITRRLEDELRAAYESGDRTKITEAQNRITKFTSSLSYSNDACITGETLITMGDGSQKPIRMLKAGDEVRSWRQGVGDTIVPLYTPLEHKAQTKTALTLHFSNGATIRTVDGHGFLLADKHRFVTISHENYKKYINKAFYVTPTEFGMLIAGTTETITEKLYSPMASKYMCLYTNGILSTAHLTEFICNARLAYYKRKDLITYDQVPESLRKDVSEELFNAYDGEMLKVWAKGFKKFFISKKIRKLIALLD